MPPPRLDDRSLVQARPGVRLPSYARNDLSGRIVHLGLGNFARAHLADYVEDALEAGERGWGIIGVSLQRPDQRDRLAPQDGLYTALQREGSQVRPRIIGCLKQVLVAPENPSAVIDAMANESCRIVSLTVTEKGYCFDAASRQLDLEHPAILADLRERSRPRSVFGFLAAALRARRDAGLAPFTILCCDNLPENGRLLARLLDAFVRRQDEGLADWIAHNVMFPSTMVDRIVPATTEADLATASSVTGLLDLAPVSHEPFRQWVIEDRFIGDDRPAWENVGAQIVGDVGAFERMKLRVLNCAHSALAYLGCLASEATIGEAAADPVFRQFVLELWHREIIPALAAPAGVDPSGYAEAVLRRFDNPAILHRTAQVASDGSQKLPVRLLGTVGERLRRGEAVSRLAHVVAAWIRYLEGNDDRGEAIAVDDPYKDRLRAALASAGSTAEAKVAAVLRFEQIFAGLSDSNAFGDAVLAAYVSIARHGIRRATATLLAPSNI
ncbi:MAG TPA: mannitol dehydrogenase family protein [Bradyrhizobium sp.]|uniref:mannitol dehydrogenase family protein n=1 Tax=Bradyrhizobium sp. TaxID=376 RepID=UPI002D7F644B|nr:mannitol dehydrogenase family protein [Bradyrhizobium sp.]HET7888872.1 mannitol dehydrogenase family protein [Bradyrhizobium sp.]